MSDTTVRVWAAGVILRRGKTKPQWLLLRGSRNKEWGFPKGHVDPGETLFDAALRECAEECGVAALAINGNPLELNYTISGGRQKTVAYFPGLTAQSDVTLSHEHDMFAWLTADKVLRRLPYDNVRNIFRAYLSTRG